MQKFFSAFMCFLLLLSLAKAQTITSYFDNPVIGTVTSGVNTVPYNITLTSGGNSVDFKAEDEINIVRDLTGNNLTTETLITSSSTSGNTTFRAYLVPPLSYAELQTEQNGSVYGTINNNVCFRFEEKYNQGGQLNYKVYNYLKQQVTGLTLSYANLPISAAQSLLLGTNYLSVNMSSVTVTNDTDSIFMLEVTNSKGEKSYLRFKLIKVN